MRKFSIADLERFSNIKAHTFRIWELRYNFLKPQRTETNIRYYTLGQVRDLLDIALLNKCGFRISRLAGMNPLKIREVISGLTSMEERKGREINNLIIAMFSADIEAFETILNACVGLWGIDSVIKEIIVPFMERIGLLFYCDTSSETHFVVAAVRKKIISGIEAAKPFRRIEKTALFFLPEEEHYDLMLLYMNYLVKGYGCRNLYMGTNISLENLKNTLAEKRPELVFTYFPPKHTFPIDDFIQYIDIHFPSLTFIVSGYTGKLFEGKVPGNVKLIHHRDIEKYLQSF